MRKLLTRHAPKLLGTALVYSGLTSVNDDTRPKTAKCCGIIGYLGKAPDAAEVLIQGIDLLQNRGYDSVGLATVDNLGKLRIVKQTSNYTAGIDCIVNIKKTAQAMHLNHHVGIAHTRWATCGEITNVNAHPHCDAHGRIALVHNGTVYNHAALRDGLRQRGIEPVSQTDTEVIALLIGVGLDAGLRLFEAVKAAVEQLDGTWGLVIMSRKHPNKLIAACKGSPVVVGLGEQSIYVSSEIIGFQKYTSKYFKLEDSEIIELSLDEGMHARVTGRVHHADKVEIKQTPTPPFDTFFEEEVFEQPEALMRALGYMHRLMPQLGATKLGGFDTHREQALAIDNLVLIGCGSSLNACMYAMHLFKLFEVFNTVTCVEASSFDVHDLPKQRPGVICLTQSGETADCLRSVALAKGAGVTVIGVTNVVGSSMTHLCDFGVFTNSGREISVGATKSFTSQIAVLYLIVLWYSHHRNAELHRTERKLVTQMFLELPTAVRETLESNREPAKAVARALAGVSSMYVLGKGSAYPFAREMSLKFKELTYIHAEALPAGELKHGPLALIVSDYEERNMPRSVVIVIALDCPSLKSMEVTISELKTRQAIVIVVTDCREKLDCSKIDYVLEVPKMKPFAALLSLLPMQLVVKEVAALKGIQIDKPRNLAKCVSVI